MARFFHERQRRHLVSGKRGSVRSPPIRRCRLLRRRSGRALLLDRGFESAEDEILCLRLV